MPRKSSIAVLVASLLLAALPPTAVAQTPPTPAEPPSPVVTEPARPAWKDKLFLGGGVGLSFGDIDYVELAPLVGYQLNPRISIGTSAFYRWTSDDRYQPKVDTNDYGASIFTRVGIVPPLFAQLEFEYANYEYPTVGASTERSSDSNVLVGGGFLQPAGGHGGVYVTVLYNLTYDSNDFNSPYDSPWVYRVGFTFGF